MRKALKGPINYFKALIQIVNIQLFLYERHIKNAFGIKFKKIIITTSKFIICIM